MSQTLTQKDSYKSLQTTFENTFGVKADRNAYNNYSKKYFTFITDRKGNSYYIDERTNKRVTTAYKKNLESKLTKSYQEISNVGKLIQTKQVKEDFNVLDKQNDLNIAKSRGRFFPPAKEGDLPRRGDTPHKVFNTKGELVIKGGKTQYLKNKAISDAEEELRIAKEKSNDVNINRHRQALKVMGIKSRTWQNPYYGDKRDYEEGGVYEGKTMPGNTTKVTPAQAPTTGEVFAAEQTLNKQKEEPQLADRNEKGAPAGYDLRSDVHTIDPNTGEALGVMTRSARRKWEAANMPKVLEKRAELGITTERKYYDKGKLLRIGVG